MENYYVLLNHDRVLFNSLDEAKSFAEENMSCEKYYYIEYGSIEGSIVDNLNSIRFESIEVLKF